MKTLIPRPQRNYGKAPTGMDPARVNLPLTTAEKSQLRAAAISEERSDGAMARQIYLLGAQIYFSVEGAVAHEK